MRHLLRRRPRRGAPSACGSTRRRCLCPQRLSARHCSDICGDQRTAGNRQCRRIPRMDAYRTATLWRGGAALHFDPGMNRLGFAIEEAPLFAARVKMPDHGISLIMSHLACAETPSHALNVKQVAVFRDLRFMFRGTATSLANSSGIFLGPATHCDMVRPGAALFGVNPTPATQNLMEPVVSLKARIVQVREVLRGETVGYGATWTAARASRVAVVSVGYGDGYPRAASSATAKGRI